jgi:hypothetical protein
MSKDAAKLICPECLHPGPKGCDDERCPGPGAFVSPNSAKVAMRTFMGCQRRAELLDAALRRGWPFLLDSYLCNDCPTGELREAVEEAAGILELDLAAEIQKRRAV